MKRILCALVLCALSPASFAAVNVFACEPEWAALVQHLAGAQASVYTATTAQQDPHRIEARPSLIAKARRAQLVVCTGADLEVGWLPMVLSESANQAIQPNAQGYFEAAHYVQLLDVPTQVDRSHGDVHAKGNPHIQMDARNFLPIADALSKRLSLLDPQNSSFYQQQLATFSQQWRNALTRWESQASVLKGVSVVAQHNGFPYLNQWLGLKQVSTLEPKPGLEPSVVYLASVLSGLQAQPARMVIRAAYQSGKSSDWLAQKTRINVVELPYTVGGSSQAKDLFSLFDDTLMRLLAGAK